MKNISFWVCVILFWLAACSPKKVEAIPSPTPPPPTDTPVPPTVESEFVTYRDPKNKFEITYSKEVFTPDPKRSDADMLTLVLNVQNLFPGQNLEDVFVSVSAEKVCRFKDIYYEDPDKETINDIDFSVYSTRDSGTFTNNFETLTYQTVHNELCYEIHLNIREYSLTAYPQLTEYDPELLLIEYKNLLNTFKFVE